jgi:5'(3')-deoxyribonucleotidase
MDGVLADVYEQFKTYSITEFGTAPLTETLHGKPEHEAYPNAYQYVNSAGFFINAPFIDGSVEALKTLNEQYNLFIVSSAMEFPGSLKEKYDWLNKHFPFITWQQIVFCGTKTIINGDIMIDDHFKNLDYFKGKTLLFTQYHNYGHNDKHHHRVNNWSEILALLT